MFHIKSRTLQQVLDKHEAVFEKGLGTMKKFKAKLHLKSGATPKFVKAWPVPFALRPKVEASLQKVEASLQKLECWRRSLSEWGSPIVVVSKKIGGVRICGDYKVTLNQVLDVDQHPLPKPSDLFATLAGGKVLSKLDQVEYLGHIIDKDGLYPVPEKVRAITDAPAPSNVSELRSYLGMLQYYARFLPNLSSELSPLHDLLKDKTRWLWTDKCQAAFLRTKQLLTSASVLTHYDVNLPIRLECDAFSVGLGAVISHEMLDGTHEMLDGCWMECIDQDAVQIRKKLCTD